MVSPVLTRPSMILAHSSAVTHSAAVFGASTLLSSRFGDELDTTPKAQQVAYLLKEAPGQTQEKRELYAIAWGCALLEDKSYVAAGGFEELLAVFRSDTDVYDQFIAEYLVRC